MPKPQTPPAARHLPAAERASRAWKNGGGETADVAIAPPGAGLEDFDWRISVARVGESGPFSLFPGVERTMAILSGRGLRLAVAGSEAVELTCDAEPYAFAGDADTEALLLGGPVTDLNVMTRRGRATASLRRLRLSPGSAETMLLGPAVLFWAEGEGVVEVAALTVAPAALDAVQCEAPARWRLRSEQGALAYLVELG